MGLHDDPSGLPFIGNNEMETEVGPPLLESLISSFGAQHCLPNQFYTIYAAAQSPTQTSFLNYGKHPPILRECILANPFFMTPSEYLTFIFMISDLRSIKERPLS